MSFMKLRRVKSSSRSNAPSGNSPCHAEGTSRPCIASMLRQCFTPLSVLGFIDDIPSNFPRP